jgi:hypothetical protein
MRSFTILVHVSLSCYKRNADDLNVVDEFLVDENAKSLHITV